MNIMDLGVPIGFITMELSIKSLKKDNIVGFDPSLRLVFQMKSLLACRVLEFVMNCWVKLSGPLMSTSPTLRNIKI